MLIIKSIYGRVRQWLGVALASAYGRWAFALSSGVSLGLLSDWVARFLFKPGWPLAAYSNIGWLRIVVGLTVFLAVLNAAKRCLAQFGRWRWEYEERFKNLDFPSWVELRRLGESNAVKLTALAPVLGSLVLMNDEVDALLRSTLLDFRLDLSPKPMLGFVTIPRLHMIYLGLSLLGVGSIGFGLFCPDIIKRYASAADWLEREDRFLTGGRLRGEFISMVSTYHANTRPVPADVDDDEEGPTSTRSFYNVPEERRRVSGYSAERYYQIHALIDEIVEKEDPSIQDWHPPATEPSTVLAPDGSPALREEEPAIDADAEVDDAFRRFRAGARGHVNTNAWLQVLDHRIGFERNLWESLTYTASDFFKERIIDIRYQDFAYESRATRGGIFGVYALGIAALIIPTLHTFGAIVESALR